MPKVYIGVGSNQGERYGNIDLARSLLEGRGIAVQCVSPLYETEAECRSKNGIGCTETSPSFINGVYQAETDRDPETLLTILEEIEREMGRLTKGDWGPRPIDLDILLYDNLVYDSPTLKIPHPEMAKRTFVLRPLADLAPELVHPVLATTVRELLNRLASAKITAPAR